MCDRQCALNHDATESAQCRNCSRDPDHAHLGSTHKTKTSHGRPVYKIWSLWRYPLQRYYMGCKILKRVIWPWPRPFQGRFFFDRVERAMVSLCTKYEVSRFTCYEAVNGGAKCGKCGGLGWLGGTQGQQQCHHSIERVRLPIRL